MTDEEKAAEPIDLSDEEALAVTAVPDEAVAPKKEPGEAAEAPQEEAPEAPAEDGPAKATPAATASSQEPSPARPQAHEEGQKNDEIDDAPDLEVKTADAKKAKRSRDSKEQTAKPKAGFEDKTMTDDLDSTDVETLLKQLDIAKREIQELKAKIAKASKKKESAFRKKREFSKNISDKLNKMGGSKQERNKITNHVRELKKQRDALNTQIHERVKEIKKLNEQHKNILEKFGRRNNPSMLSRKIEELEYKLETQPMGFEAEQKLTKKLKELKKEYAGVKDQAEAWETIRAKSKEIDQLKREANKFHRQVQEHAQESQAKHEALIAESSELSDMKKQEEDLYKAFLREKEAYVTINQALKNKVTELQRIKESLSKRNVKLKEEQKQEEMKTLKERAKEAEEKVKGKKKLTTEDILALQGMKK